MKAEVLAEAIAWCAATLDPERPETSLRSAALAPSTPFVNWDPETRRGEDPSAEERRRIVDDLCAKRRGLLQDAGIEPCEDLASQAGRVLVSDIDSSDWSQLSETASRGFVDDGDVPPWDTWLWIEGDGHLHSWVPAEFVPLVVEAIDVNPLMCLEWDWGPVGGPFRGPDPSCVHAPRPGCIYCPICGERYRRPLQPPRRTVTAWLLAPIHFALKVATNLKRTPDLDVAANMREIRSGDPERIRRALGFLRELTPYTRGVREEIEPLRQHEDRDIALRARDLVAAIVALDGPS